MVEAQGMCWAFSVKMSGCTNGVLPRRWWSAGARVVRGWVGGTGGGRRVGVSMWAGGQLIRARAGARGKGDSARGSSHLQRPDLRVNPGPHPGNRCVGPQVVFRAAAVRPIRGDAHQHVWPRRGLSHQGAAAVSRAGVLQVCGPACMPMGGRAVT